MIKKRSQDASKSGKLAPTSHHLRGHVSKAVAASVGLLKIFNYHSIVLNVIESAMLYANRVLMHPGDKKYWQIDISEMIFDSKIGKFKGGIELMNALGFEGPSNLNRFLNVRTTGQNPSIAKDTLTMMKRGIMELQQHLNGLSYVHSCCVCYGQL